MIHHTTCPLDCPDSCSLEVTVEDGQVQRIDGSHANPVTRGFICAKVRRFGERLYGRDRLQTPAIREGDKGAGQFRPVSWDEALDRIAGALQRVHRTWGGEAILPYSYGGSNGLLTQDTSDATFFRRLGASRLARTICAAPTGAALDALYGRMPSVAYEDARHARLLIVWGANPSTSGSHLVPHIRDAQRQGATVIVIDPRTTSLARLADVHLALRPGTDLPVALALHRHLFETGRADTAFLATHTRGADQLRDRAMPWTIEAASREAGVSRTALHRIAECYADASPALIRCGWGPERNRNGGSAVLAILALPAVAGKFGVRGGGFMMSNSASWGIERQWIDAPDPPTRRVNMNRLGEALAATNASPIKALFVYNANPASTAPDQRQVLNGLARTDLFTVVFDQVMTDTARYADIVLPATTFLEGFDLARAYGPISLRVVRPAIEPVGEARTNIDVFSDLARRMSLGEPDDPADDRAYLARVMEHIPSEYAAELRAGNAARPPWDGRPVQFQDVWPRTPDRRVNLFPPWLDKDSPKGLYSYQPDPASTHYPLALISPACTRSISSTLAELDRPETKLEMHAEDATARGLTEGQLIRAYNDLGEVACPVTITDRIRPSTVTLPKGLWARHTRNGLTANALVPDTLTDFGGGACFNDARVEVEPAPTG